MPRGVYERKPRSKQGRLVSTISLDAIPTSHTPVGRPKSVKMDDKRRLAAAIVVLLNRVLGE